MPDHDTRRRANNEDKVLAYLQQHREATNAQLLAVGGFRFGARIFSLRQKGYRIETAEKHGGLVTYRYLGFAEPGQMPLALSA